MKEVFFIIIFFHCILFSVWGQDASTRVYEAPNNDFNDVVLPTHKNLLRLGFISSKSGDIKTIEKNFNAFRALLQFKIDQKVENWDDPFSTIDNNLPYRLAPDKPLTKETARFNSILGTVLRGIISDKAAKTYFKEYYAGTIWKGDSFEQIRNYRTFVKKHFQSLTKWPNQLIPEGSEDVYYVTVDRVSNYDFDNGGILLSLGFANVSEDNAILRKVLNKNIRFQISLKEIFFSQNHSDRGSNSFDYSPRNSYERNIDQSNGVVFFEIDLEEANEVLKLGRLYVLRKLKLNDDFTFNITSPVIELYQNESLTEKIGELNYNDLIFYE